MKKSVSKSPVEEKPLETIPESKTQKSIRFGFQGREYDTSLMTDEEWEFVRKFPEQIPFLD